MPETAPANPEKLALFRAYRPQDFSDLVGQEHVQRTILNALKLGRAAHAYLFSGPRGTGKTSTARLVAKGLLCPELLDDPSATSPAWQDILVGRHLDLIEIDAASNRGIDDIRDLRDKVRFSPTQGPKKVYIIDEVHMLTTEAFNALLKTLEEPPAHAHFVLATTELHKVPATIISRCQHFAFRRIPDSIIAARLQHVAELEQLDVEPEAITTIAHSATGSMRDALVLFEQVASPGQRTTKADVQTMLGLVHADAVSEFLLALLQGDAATSLRLIHELYEKGADLASFTRDVISALRQRMVANVQSGQAQAVPFELAAVRALEQALQDQRVAGIPELPLELAVLELLQPTGELQAAGSKPQSPAPSPQPPVPSPSPQAPNPQPPAPSHTPEVAAASIVAAERTPPPVAAEAPPVVEGAGDLLAQWPAILASVKSAAVKLTAREARATTPDDATLVLSFQTKFKADKVNTDTGRHALGDAVLAVTGRRVTVRVEHDPSARPTPVAGGAAVPTEELDAFFGGTSVS